MGERSDSHPIRGNKDSLIIACAYALFGILWILWTDKLLSIFTDDPSVIIRVSMYKGWVYVVLSALLIYLLARYYISKTSRSEQRFRILFESAPDAIYLTDVEGVLLDGNKAAEKLTGYKKEELLGKNFNALKLLAEDSLPEAADNLVDNAEDKQTGPDEFALNRKDGAEIIAEISAHSVTIGNDSQILGIARDITDRRRAEEQLRESEARYRTLFETANDAIFILRDDMFIDCNSKTLDLFSVSEEQIIGKKPVDFSPPVQPDGEHSQERFYRLLEAAYSGKPQSFEWLHTKADGAPFHTEISLNSFSLGDAVQLFAIVRDITDRKRAEKQLKESEARYRTLFETANDAILILKDDEFIDCNSKTLEIFGASEEQIIGKTPFDLSPPVQYDGEDTREKGYRILKEAHSGKPQFFEWMHEKPDGSSFHTEIGLNRMTLEDEDHLFTILRDITERKQAEENLRQRVQELSALNNLGHKTSSSLAFDQVVKASIQEVSDSIHPDIALFYMRDGDHLILKGHYRGDTKIDLTMARSIKVGVCLCGLAASREKPVFSQNIHSDPQYQRNECIEAGLRSMAILPIHGKDGVIGVLTLGSITERRFEEDSVFLETLAGHISIALQNALLYEEVRRHTYKLEEVVSRRTQELRMKNEDLESFTHSVSHDLKAPLRAVQGFADILVDDLAEQLDEEHKEDLLAIKTAAEGMDELINDLLEYSRLGRQAVDRAKVSLERVVQLAQSNLQTDIEECNASIQISGPLPTLYGHEPTLVQLMANLIGNAIKFVDPGKHPRVEIETMLSDNNVRVSIRDNGVGINPEYQNKIFRIFERLHSAEEYPGTGIGLAIVKKAVDIHGGSVGVHSEPGKGSTFWFEIPTWEKAT